MSTFCRITGKSRNLPKPNYFPLLPPISPVDAKRFCKITSKAYGLPNHHYIPVLLGLPYKKKTEQSPIDSPSSQKQHVLLSDFHYVFPHCEDSSDLSQLLASKKTDSNVHYVYKVAERRCSLVVSAEFEAAVRDGDIKNVMLAKDSDTLLLKLKRGGDVAVDVSELSIDGLELYDGEGPSEEVVNLRPKRKRGAGGTDLVRKIFEEKERAAEKAEESTTPKKPKVMKLDPSKLNGFKPNKVQPQVWNKFKIESRDIIRGCGADIFNNIIEKFDVEKVGKGKKKTKEEPVATSMPTPVLIEPEIVPLGESIPGVIQQPVMVPDNVAGFETTLCVAPLTPLIVEPEPNLQAALKNLDSSDLSKTAHVAEVFKKESPDLNLLPTINELPELMNNISNGIPAVEERDGKKVHGLKLDVNAAQRFIVGLSVLTPNGSVFVPGQTVSTPNGDAFLPGMTVLTPEGPKLIPGHTVPVEDPSGETKMVFIAGQNLNTRDGEKFVQGQTLVTSEGSKFMPGQTVVTSEGPKFIPGQVIKGDDQESPRFVTGQTVSTTDGPQFVPGQTFSESNGETIFIPGQSIPSENGWDFVPGQTLHSMDGEVKFVPGQTVNTSNGPYFVPGQTTSSINNEPVFVPGVSVVTEDGPKFVPGATVDTPEGRKFVEGQVMKSENGNLNFVPGTTSTADNGSFKFATAQSLDDVVFHDNMSLGLSMDSAAIHTTEKSDSIYGHMVQTSQGVEFFPGVASGLPAGKVVPGRLVRGKEVKFVPGVIIDDKFVPGQVVTTDRGEQFIPGQVVETKEGAKFVPGQIVETRQGPKFVPGQTIETEEGPKFVPGQIVQTKAGPTFIPGQVISTDNEGSRFVPGQVVDTVEGPRFVPGRVIETGDNVTFIPGQVVETSEGLRFIASDLQDNPEGEIQFTVQGFSVTPEELSLLKPHTGSNSIFAPASGEETIDSRMMRQLSEAGMVLGRQVPAEVPVVDVRTVPAMGIACTLCTKLGLDAVTTIKISQIMATVADLNCNIPIDHDSVKKNKYEVKALKTLLKATSHAESEFGAYTAICGVLEKILCSKPDEMVSIVDMIHKFVLTSEELAPLRDSKVRTLKELMNGDINGDVVDKLLSVLGDNESVSVALKHFGEGNPDFIESIIKKISETCNGAINNKDAADTLERAIIDAVRDSSELSVLELLQDSDGIGFKSLILEAVGLAKALGMRDVAATLLGVISDPNSVELLAGDKMTMDILRRLTVMRQLAEKRPNFKSALGQLKSDPELARSDPLVRELVRVSGALMIVPEESPLIQNSKDIPTSLLQTDNSLAMEDFMLRSQRHGILLIIKHGLQAVVPRDAARAVLTGQVPYTVLDESGIHHFAPLHVFSALHLPPMYTHRFSMYSVQTTDDDANTLTPGTSISDLRKTFTTASNPETTISEEGGEIIYTANQDYLADDLDALTLHRGDQVIVLETGGGDPSKRLKLDPDLDLGVDVGTLLDNSAARHKIAVRPKRKHTDSRHRETAQDERWLVQSCDNPMQQGWVPASILTPHDDSPEETQSHDAKYRREAVIRELVETEEEFGRDIQQVVNFYMKPLDSKSVPAIIRDNKDLIFGNLKQIAEFHNTVLIEGVKYYANEPRMLGKTFLRLERDFDKHVSYCRDEPLAQDFLLDNIEVRDFFEELSQQLGDDKSLSEHLKLPIQRINDYQLLLKELVKYSNRLGEDTTDLGKALELMLAVPHRANDNKFISNIEGYHGNIHKLGRLLRHDWFCVTDREGKSKERYLFLFKARILVCKVRRIAEDRSVFVLKDIIRLPEVEVKDHKDDPRVFELHHKQPGYGSFPLVISAHKDKVKDAWLTEIRQYASDVLALAEHAADDLRLQETEENKNLEPLVGIHIEPATPDQTIPLEPRDNQEPVLKRTKKSPRTSPEPSKKPRSSPEVPTVKDEDSPKPKKVLEEKEPPEPVKVQEPYKSVTENVPLKEPPFAKKEIPAAAKREFQEDIKTVEEIQVEAQLSTKRKDEEKDSSTVDKKVKIEDEEMDPYSSYSSRRSSSRRVEEFRSVSSSSSQEVYVETSSSRHQMASGISSSHNVRMVEESAMVNGRTVSHMREISGGGDGYTTIQEITSGSEGLNDYAIEDVTHKTKSSGGYSAIKDSSSVVGEERSEVHSSKRESSSVTSSDKKAEFNRSISVKKPVFKKTIEGMNVEPGHKAVFECEVEEKAKVLWLKDNKPLEDKLADRISAVSNNDTKHRLQILGAHECDSGTYTARATNDEGGIASCTAHLLVETLSDEEKKRRKEANAPYFLVRLNDTELLENTYLRFMVKVKGNPNPEVKFYKNDRLITVANERVQIMKDEADKGFYELIIPDVQEEDAGTYKCIAMNKFGESECEGTVTVTDDKNLFEGLEEADLLKPGESPNFTWFRDGKPFDPEERFKVLFQDEEDSLALVFQHVKPEDAGLYTCVASTTTGKISCSAELTVQGSVHVSEKPKIKAELKQQETTVGGSAMLELTVEGYPKPELTWTKDGKELTVGEKYKLLYEDQESMGLVIKSVTTEDAGDYTVEAKNELGVDTEVIHLTVKYPPKIKRKLTDFSGMAGEDIKLTVGIEGCPKPDVTWYKDGKVIKKSDRVKTYDEESASFTLVIEKSTLDDSGSYSVVATNELSQISEFCKVEVHSPPEFIKTMTKTVETNEDDTVTFQVKVQGDPQPTVKWIHNGTELKADGNHIKISEDGSTHTLVVHGINRHDAGKYTCEIKNIYGSTSDNSQLNVRCKPVFREKLVDTTAREGDSNVEFTVNVEAFPKPSIKWFHNEVEVTEKTTEFTRIEEGDTFKLVVKEVTKELSGKYSCIVTNNYGKDDCSATFTVKTKPTFRKGLKDTQVDEGATLTLEIEVEGTPPPEIKWFKDGEEVSGDARIKITRDTQRIENYSMTLTLVKAGDAGIYEAHATNEMGTTATISTVTVQTKTTAKKKEAYSMEEVPVEKPQKTEEVEPVIPEQVPEPEPPKEEPPKEEPPKPEPEPPKPKVEPEPPKPEIPQETPKPEPELPKPKVEPEPPKPKVEPEPQKPKEEPEPQKPKEEPEPPKPKVEPEPEQVKPEPVVEEAVEPPKKAVEVDVEPPPKPLVKEEISKNEEEPPKKSVPEEVEPPKKAVKEIVELPPKAEAEEVVTEPPKKAPVTEPKEEPQKAVEEGVELKKVTPEDNEDEAKDLYNVDESISQLVNSFTCVEVIADQIMYQDLPNSNSGLVEEFSESEDKGIKISLSRNVSIVSVSEDERQTPLPEDATEPKFNIDRKKSFDSEKSKAGEMQDCNENKKGRKLSTGVKEEMEADKIRASKMENVDNLLPQKGLLNKDEEADFGKDNDTGKCSSDKKIPSKGRKYSIETQDQDEANQAKSSAEGKLTEPQKGRRLSAEIKDSNELDAEKPVAIDNKSQKGAILEDQEVDFWGDNDKGKLSDKQSFDEKSSSKGRKYSIETQDQVEGNQPKSSVEENLSHSKKGRRLSAEIKDSNGFDSAKSGTADSKSQKGTLTEGQEVDFWGDADSSKLSRKEQDGEMLSSKGRKYSVETQEQVQANKPKSVEESLSDSKKGRRMSAEIKDINGFDIAKSGTADDKSQKGKLLEGQEVDFWGDNEDTKQKLRKQSDSENVSTKGRKYSIETQDQVKANQLKSSVEENISDFKKGRKMSAEIKDSNGFDTAKSETADGKLQKGTLIEDQEADFWGDADTKKTSKIQNDGEKVSTKGRKYSIETQEEVKANQPKSSVEENISESKKVRKMSAEIKDSNGFDSVKSGAADGKSCKGTLLEEQEADFWGDSDTPKSSRNQSDVEMVSVKGRRYSVETQELVKVQRSESVTEGNIEQSLKGRKLSGVISENEGDTKSQKGDCNDKLYDGKKSQKADLIEKTEESISPAESAKVTRRKSQLRVADGELNEEEKSAVLNNLSSSNKSSKFDAENVEGGNDASEGKTGTAEVKPSMKGKISDDNDDLGDSKVEALLKRIQKQRSVLEEILDKEIERAESEAAPEILFSDVKDIDTYESLSIKYEIKAKGIPRPDATWLKDGKEIHKSDHVNITEDGNKYCLEIKKLKMEDAGNYKCKLFNRLGEKVESGQVSLSTEATFRGPIIKVPLKNLVVPKDENAVLTVVLTGDPVPEVKWTHDGHDVDENFSMRCENSEMGDGLKECTFTLTIPSGRHKDTGTYKFVAKNKFGTDECSARLDIVFRPEIIGLKDVTITPFHDTEIVAYIVAHPRPMILWSAAGKDLKLDNRVYVENDTEKEIYKLIFKNVGIDDGKTYTVKAINNMGEASDHAKLTVHTEIPTILKELKDEYLTDYTPFEFKVRANGVPKPTISWFKDGKPIVSTDNVTITNNEEGQVSSSLSIAHFSQADVAKYTVKAANLAGEAESSAYLKMTQIPPSFAKALDRSVEIAEGEPLELKAKVEGSPTSSIKWLKDGRPLKADDHIKMVTLPDGTVKLTIDNVKPADSGAYKVVATNHNGESSSTCAVAVTPNASKPIFSKELEDVKVKEGQPLKLEAQVFAFPSPEMKWTKDGHPLRQTPGVNFINSPGGLVGLAIEKVKPEDAGIYTLSLSNKLGDASSTAKVEVAAKDKKPQFLSQLMPVVVVEGFPAKLEVKVAGHPQPELVWTFNGKPIVPDGQHIKIVDGPDGTQSLVIDKADPKDTGIYAVTAKNSQGEATSQAPLNVTSKGRLDVPEEPPSFPKGLRDTSTDEGTPLIFSTPFLGNPIPDVTWFKDGVPLEADERIIFTCDGKKVGLEISPSKLSDAGTYTCKLKNPHGEAETSAKAGVKKIFEKPHFTQPLSDVQQLFNLDAKLFARVSGFPKPDILWYRDGQPIEESKKFRMKRDGDAVMLYVQDCAPEDTGIYRCIASNKEGLATCDANLAVVAKLEKKEKAEPPSFLKKIGDTEVFKGMTAKFTACATGSPDPDVEWLRDGEKLYQSERIRMEKEGTGLLRLTLLRVDPQLDVGKYCCRIFNPHGEASCEAQLVYESLEVRPKKPVGDQYSDFDKFRASGLPIPLADKPIISRMTDRRLTLSWKPSIPNGPRDPVTYQVEMCELPNGEWFTARTGVRSCACDISNLEPFRDYKFRVRVENKYGVSDPSPYAQTFRERLLPDPPKFVPYLPPGIDFRPETSPYFPKDFDIERPPHDGYAQAPRFLRQEHAVQYGVKNQSSNLFWFVYGYPKPSMSYYFNDEPIEMGGRYDSSYTRNGQATLFINKMLERDVGVYEAVAHNEHGEARQRVRMEIAEYPEFIKRPEETIIMMRRSGRLEARVIGVPYPEIKWFKDWQPITSSSRIKIQFVEPDKCVLIINDAIGKDEGLYSISARNVAGCVSSSAMVRIEESEAEYSYNTYSRPRSIKPKTKLFGDFYDLGDELGRGTQGITYHAVERQSGHNYAAKVMHGKEDLRPYMRNELEIMNLLNHRKLIRLHDAYETPNTFTLVSELAGGGELLNNITKQTFTTESEIAGYIQQILQGLEHMHDRNIAHLGLTPGDLLISHAGGKDLKIGDFGLSRHVLYNKIGALDYGMPEFVAPEVVNKEGAGFPADMWSVGVITHLLLTGISLFRGVDDRTTLTNIKEKRWEFNEDVWKNLSSEARDFITRLLVYDQESRMDVKSALRHPWFNFIDKKPDNEYNIITDTLRNYYNSLKDWYSNASCRTWYRRRPLEGAFTHPSRMVYPPGDRYTPDPTPDRRSKEPYSPKTWEDQIPSREPIDYDIGLVKSESHYQNGPDTYLLQLRDVNFPVRLREYMKVAANRSPGYSREVADNNHLDWRAPVIRERRRFTDVMDEEIDDERKARINKYGSSEASAYRRLKHELGTRLDAHVEADALLASKRDGLAPFFREKPQILPIQEERNAELVCFVVGDPKPTVQWFKNDLVLTESSRLKIVEDEAGRSILKFQPALSMDVGIYKVVARNKLGQVVARTRVVLASIPNVPDSPEASEISDTEILLRWKQPQEDGNTPIICYSLQYKKADDTDWLNIASNIDHEFYLVKDLEPGVAYQFRVAAMNKIGWGLKSIPTEPIKTKDAGAPKVQISKAMKHLQSLSETGQEIVVEETKPILDYSTELFPISWSNEHPSEKYNFISEIARGRFSVVVKGIDKTNDQVVVAKVIEWRPDTEMQVTSEFDTLKTLRHERIAALTHAYRPANATIAVLVQEKLQGADVLTYISSKHEYTEQMVATVITQVLDGLQYMHWRGFCHLDLQPDNIVMASVRSVQIKLVDMGSAQRVSKLGTIVHQSGHPEYTAPEVLCAEPAYSQSDIWSVGVLAYVLLSGTSPFKGANREETRQNINFVRYRFEHLYKELTQEATRFIMLVFKRTPSKRPVAEECHEHRWLQPTEYMIKRRERAVFLGNRLKEYSEAYHSEKAQEVTKCDSLTSVVGGRNAALARSNSIQEELLTSF